jgi:hypothetical protein
MRIWRMSLIAKRSDGFTFDFVADAVVDHPPRRLPSGRQLAAMHECDVILWRKHPGTRVSTTSFLWQIFRSRTRRLLAVPLDRDSFSGVVALVVELVVTTLRMPVWKRRHLSRRSMT